MEILKILLTISGVIIFLIAITAVSVHLERKKNDFEDD